VWGTTAGTSTSTSTGTTATFTTEDLFTAQ